MTGCPLIFDRTLVRQHITRARPMFEHHNALFNEVGDQLLDRLRDVKRKFPTALDLSPFRFLKTQKLICSVTSLNDDTEQLDASPESFDLITNNLGLHWVNDLPGVLTQIHMALKKDGMFLGALIGEQSLHELRSCIIDAEVSVTGGISPRLSPTIDLLTASQLMQRAGFTLPVADKETITVLYKDMFALMRELRGMGQTNAHTQRLRHPTRRTVFFEAAHLYQERFGNTEGHIPATFDIIYLHGWK